MTAPRASLRRRLTALCALLTVAALAFTGFDSFQRERNTLQDNTRNKLTMLARMVAFQVRSSVEFDATEDVQNLLNAATTTMELQAAAVYLQGGKRLAVAGDPTLLPIDSTGDRAGTDDWLVEARLSYRGPAGEPLYGLVLIRASIEPDRAILATFLRGLIATDLLTLLVLGLTAHWLLSRLLRPISTLVETTHQVRCTEDYSLRASTTADDEIGALVRAFNSMLATIEERDTHLEGNAERLEHQVQERTAALSRALKIAESATQAKSTFVANMSHEIRTPLNAVLGMADLAMEADDPRELREYLGVIRSAGANLLGILCDILDLSKIESEKLELSPVPTDIESLVLDALRPLTSRIQSRELELTCELAPELQASYLVDDVRLRQILTNLVGNAIKFTAKGFVRVGLRLHSLLGDVHELELSVQDSGVGIPEDRLKAIFTPFTQADATITRRFAGTGLGLSITDRLVRMMGGYIKVESQLDRGTTFRVFLPLTTCEDSLPALPKLPDGTRILLVSRSESMGRSVLSIGTRAGIETLWLPDLDQLRGLGPLLPLDCLLLDERDPDHDEALGDLVPVGARGIRPLLLATSLQDLATASARCRNHQYAGYLTKPLSGRELAARLISVLQGSAAEQVLEATDRNTRTAHATRPMRILVAEDNAINQKLIERILQRDGHEVTIAENGRACCEAWARDQFDLVLMDMQMPEMSGPEATAQIRGAEKSSGQHIPIIALTANTTAEDRQSCLQAGMDEVLPKPVSIPKLRDALARFGVAKGGPTESPDPEARPLP